jgi:hypothetical protein
MRALICAICFTSLAASADGLMSPEFNRVPKCEVNSPHLYGHPIIASSAGPMSIERQEDLHVDTPRGRFSLLRTWVANRAGLGQVFPFPKSVGDCALPIVNSADTTNPGLLKSPYGQNYSSPMTANELAVNNLSSTVDTRCSLYTRVLTPEADTRFFGPMPSLAIGQSAWVDRTPDALVEPSRLKATKNANGSLTFDWYHEDGRRFRYEQRDSFAGPNGQYRISQGYNPEGLLLFDLQYGYPVAVPAYSPLADGGMNPYPSSPPILRAACNFTVEPLERRSGLDPRKVDHLRLRSTPTWAA